MGANRAKKPRWPNDAGIMSKTCSETSFISETPLTSETLSLRDPSLNLSNRNSACSFRDAVNLKITAIMKPHTHITQQVTQTTTDTQTVRAQSSSQPQAQSSLQPQSPSLLPSTHRIGVLEGLGLFGYEAIEPVILASLITKDPLLLIGEAGTGKTFLLNRLSEALGLNHRHYNASQISFDDLIGFPHPESDGSGIRFLPTPATIWEAESVLVDELNRCKPETQNKFFSIIHERRVHGIAIPELRYRWAAMNPFSFMEGSGDMYEGTEPLDPALADRFAFLIHVPDWHDLTNEQQLAVMAHSPVNLQDCGDERNAGESSTLKKHLTDLLNRATTTYNTWQQAPPEKLLEYVRLFVQMLGQAELRVSPRRVQMLVRNVTAVLAIETAMHAQDDSFVKPGSSPEETVDHGSVSLLQQTLPAKQLRKILSETAKWSLPHRATMDIFPEHTILAAHAEAFHATFEPASSADRWVSTFLIEPSLKRRIEMLFGPHTDRDTRSLAVTQLLHKHRDDHETLAVFSIATFPAFNELGLLTEDALGDLAAYAIPTLEIHGRVHSNVQGVNQFSTNSNTLNHPEWDRCQSVIDTIPEHEHDRRFRAIQIFKYLLAKGVHLPNPAQTEKHLQTCFQTARTMVKQRMSLSYQAETNPPKGTNPMEHASAQGETSTKPETSTNPETQKEEANHANHA